MFSLAVGLCEAVGVEEPEGFLNLGDLMGKRAILGIVVGLEQHLMVIVQLFARDSRTGLLQDGKDPCRTSRPIELVAGRVLGKHRRIDGVGSKEALLEVLSVAAAPLELIIFFPGVGLPVWIHKASDALLYSLPDVPVQRETGWTLRYFPVEHGSLDGILCEPTRAELSHVVTGTPNQALLPEHLTRDSHSRRVLKES